jgi:hypothetical protein
MVADRRRKFQIKGGGGRGLKINKSHIACEHEGEK